MTVVNTPDGLGCVRGRRFQLRSQRIFAVLVVLVVLVGAMLAGGCGSVAPEPPAVPPTPTSDDDTSESATEAQAPAAIEVQSVSAQRCARPTRFSGAAIALGGDRFLTAHHVVEGPLRKLEVDGRPASVVSVSAERDVAVLEVAGIEMLAPTTAHPADAEDVTLITPTAQRTVGDAERIRLVVNDRDDGTRFERTALVFSGAVEEGESGSALRSGTGALIGIVVLANQDRDVSYASSVVDLGSSPVDPMLVPVGLCT